MKATIILLALSIGVNPVMAQMIQAPGSPPAGPYVDPQSGMTFPAAVGPFNRFRLARGGPPDEVSAGYSYIAAEGRVSATVIVWHPQLSRKMDCVAEAAADIRTAQEKLPGAEVSEQSEAPSVEGYPTVTGRTLHSSFSAPSGRQASEEFIYCNVGGRWLVQYIFSHAAIFDASQLEASFLHDFRWTVPNEPQPASASDQSPARSATCAPKPGEGALWFDRCKRAADAGIGYAALTVGAIYWNGDGVPKDRVEAVRWFHIADNAGDPRAAKLLGDDAFTRAALAPNPEAVDRATLDEAIAWYEKALKIDPIPASKAQAQERLEILSRLKQQLPKKVK